MNPKTNTPLAADSETLSPLSSLESAQRERLNALLEATPTMGTSIESRVLPFAIDPLIDTLTPATATILAALEKRAAGIAIRSLISLAKAGDIDHLGGGLELIPALLLTLSTLDYDKR